MCGHVETEAANRRRSAVFDALRVERADQQCVLGVGIVARPADFSGADEVHEQVLGAVRTPGLHPVDATMSVSDVLALAGGLFWVIRRRGAY